MLLIDNDNPLDSIYYIAYKFLQMVKQNNIIIFDAEETFEILNNYLENMIDFSKYLLVIDYLFIENFITAERNGDLKINVFK